MEKPIDSYENYVDTVSTFEETKRIMEAFDEYVWYDVPAGLKIEPAKARSNEVTFTLVQVLVDKGLISFADVSKTLRRGK